MRHAPKVGVIHSHRGNFSRVSSLILHRCNTFRAIETESELACVHRLYFTSHRLKIILRKYSPACEPAEGQAHMDELIGRLATNVSIDSAVAEETVGIILGFLRNEGPSDSVQALIDQIPGAEGAIEASKSGGGLSRLMGGGLMAVGTRLMGLGLGMSDIQTIARELFRYGRDKIGADQMGKIIAGTPGLSQFA
ncbi:hypothetical protein QWJ07_01570 [Frankia sp. RB7]|nr:hypothetical protein [Frankia sp. RB7]